MGHLSVVYGIIKVNDLASFRETIGNMKPDENYPWIRAEMFNVNGIEHPYYYESPITTFGSTFKNLHGGVEWSQFILKFEYLLDKLDFDFARIRFETEFLGDFEFFWGQKKESLPDFYDKDDLIERDKWYFGFGFRNMYGGLIEESEPILPYDFKYPIEFDEDIKKGFNGIICELNEIEVNTTKYFPNYSVHKVFGNDNCQLILTYLSLNEIIEYGWDFKCGFFIKRLKEIKQILTPYNIY